MKSVTLVTVAAGAAAAQVTGTTYNFVPADRVSLYFVVTSAAAAVGDTLAIIVEGRCDGTNLTPLAAITFTGTTTNLHRVAIINPVFTAGGFLTQDYSAALTNGGLNNILPADQIRCKYTITGATALFSFSVVAVPR